MISDTYRQSLSQAKADLAARIADLGDAQQKVQLAEKEIMELRQTIAALARLCGETEFVEEDALGLTDAIRAAFKATGDYPMTAQDVKLQLERMGYGGRWGNVLASIHTVIKRLLQKGEIEAAGNINGRDTFRWKGGMRIRRGELAAAMQRMAGETIKNFSDLALEEEHKKSK
jgi:hypothetical protein